jgi:hypothetical protein
LKPGFGPDHPCWKGGIRFDGHYVRIWYRNGYRGEHRVIFESIYKCCLLPWIHIHHINNDKTDNRVENLKPLSRAQHASLSWKERKGVKKS